MRSKLLLWIFAIFMAFIAYQPRAEAQYDITEATINVFNRSYTPLSSWIYEDTYPYYYTYVNVTGFPFIYDNISWRYICAYGSMSVGFGNSSLGYRYPYYYNSYDYFSYSTIPSIYGFWTMADCFYSSSPRLRIGVLGNAPERALVFEWTDMKYYYSYYNQNSSFNLQIILYEGSNNVEIQYGKLDKGDTEIGINNYTYYYYHRALIGFSGYQVSTTANWINVDPNGNGNTGYNNYESWKAYNPGSRGLYYRSTIQWNDDLAAIQFGDVIRYSFGPEFKATQPAEDVNLVKNYVYGDGSTDPYGKGDEQRPAVMINNLRTPPSPVHRQISGPISYPASPYFSVIYDATQNVPSGVMTNFTNPTPGATNIAFGTNGALDLTDPNVRGGLYLVHDILTDNGKTYENKYYFNIALQYDLEVTRVFDPKPPTQLRYPITSRVPVKVIYTSRGLTEISKFGTEVNIYDSEGNEVYNDTVNYQAQEGQELQLGDDVSIEYLSFRPKKYDTYTIKVKTTMPGDQEPTNNTFPWAGQPARTFVVSPDIEAEAYAVVEPNNVDYKGDSVKIYVGRPIIPRGRFKNNGISDISEAPVEMTIEYLSDPNLIDYASSKTVESIPSGITSNTADVDFDEFIPPIAGKYVACITVDALDDDIASNNTICDTFEVIDALNGTYTIGPDKAGDDTYNARNFKTVADVVEALFKIGMTGPVTFEFTASSYDIGDVNMMTYGPAMDLRSHIIGLSSKNTLTFKPAPTKASTRASVTLNLWSKSGIGIIMGQAATSLNPSAIINAVPSSLKSKYANSPGYITFDGGVQKSLKFVLHSETNTKLNAVFYLAQGASNMTINNCLITNSDPSNRYDDWKLPLTTYSNPNFTFEQDTRNSGNDSYSTGIMMRSIAPANEINYFDPKAEIQSTANLYGMDTLVNNNNMITNNEITGFAYGVVSLGIGPLTKASSGKLAKYYNTENTISKNLIYDVSRAGVFAGFEDNSVILMNKIYGIAVPATGYVSGVDVAGVIAGGDRRGTNFGYNNTRLTINGNEISNIGESVSAGNNFIYGIKVEQDKNTYGTESYPDIDESTIVKNNIVWGVKSGAADANRIGIRMFTERRSVGSWIGDLRTPKDPIYFTKGDKVANNTILIDNDGYNTTGFVAGVAVQHGYGTDVVNNAIAMLDNNGGTPYNYYAAVFAQGIMPGKDGAVNTNYNVYWTKPAGTPTDSAAIMRFIQIDENSNLLNEGTRNEFVTMAQWQMYSGSDFQSIEKDFTGDLTSPDITDRASKLRIQTIPTLPKNSPLNNRGEILSYVDFDIDGNLRGSSGQSYDIGAEEFKGILLNSDVEVTTTYQPGSYRSSPSTSATFSEAEYVMTEAPIDVKAELRNNGALAQTGLVAKVQIYRQKPRANFSDPAEFYTSPEIEQKVVTSITPGDYANVSFNLADGEGKEFNPIPYGDWYQKYNGKPDYTDSMYTMPAWFKTMENNVTPLYRIVVSVMSDEDNYNNVYTKTVRFYIKRSALDMLLSVEHSIDPYGMNQDVNAGHRNFDTLNVNLGRMGWINRWKVVEADTLLDQYYDIFERTAWEPRSVNYPIYTTLIWSDGDDDSLTSTERTDLRTFMKAGYPLHKKNTLISSQEMVRENYTKDQDLILNWLSTKQLNVYPDNPLNGPSYNAGYGQPTKTITDPTRYIVGVSIGRLLKQFIIKTGLTDPDPVPALMTVNTSSEGLATTAYAYNPDVVVETTPGEKEISMGVATTTISRNVINLGVDWRHYENTEIILRACLDYFEKNGGGIIPVQLMSFNAKAIGDRVHVIWETSGELNSDRFEVQRADVIPSGNTSFMTIDQVEAAGKSNSVLSYGPVIDKSVAPGNSYLYRLKMVDLDGSFTYSDEVKVNIGGSNDAWLGKPVPNPVRYNANIQIHLTEASDVTIDVYDFSGKKLLTTNQGFFEAGTHDVVLDLSSLPSGVYTYVMNVNGKMYNQQVRIVR